MKLHQNTFTVEISKIVLLLLIFLLGCGGGEDEPETVSFVETDQQMINVKRDWPWDNCANSNPLNIEAGEIQTIKVSSNESLEAEGGLELGLTNRQIGDIQAKLRAQYGYQNSTAKEVGFRWNLSTSIPGNEKIVYELEFQDVVAVGNIVGDITNNVYGTYEIKADTSLTGISFSRNVPCSGN
jgi:hypothetical protein